MNRTTLSDHTVTVHAPGGRCGDAQPGGAEPDVLGLAGGGYHQAPHRGIDTLSPLDKWAQCGERVHHAGPEIDLEDLFLFEATRLVSKARTVSLGTRLYEVDAPETP